MNCETAKDLLGAYHEGLLDPRARAGLERLDAGEVLANGCGGEAVIEALHRLTRRRRRPVAPDAEAPLRVAGFVVGAH